MSLYSCSIALLIRCQLFHQLGAISSRLAQSLADSTAPVRDTAAYKAFSQTLQEAFDDGGSALRIHADKDADAAAVRRLKRETRLRKIGRPPPSADVDVPIDETVAATGAEAEASSAAEDPIQAAAAAGAAAGAEGARKAAAEGASAGETSSAGESAKGKEAEAGASAQPRPAASQRRPAGYAVRVRGTQENSEAGSALVLRPEPAYKRAWSDFNERNPLMRKLSEMRSAYDESENPFVERLRGVTETIGSWFDENETAQVVRAFRTLDPSFTLENFQRDLREYIVPELIDAYHAAQRHLLRQWCGEATYNVLMATIDPYIQRGMISEGKLLDVRNIDVSIRCDFIHSITHSSESSENAVPACVSSSRC